jgi:hypothetical protein
MTALPQCPQCEKIGFVRIERVFKGASGVSEMMCGACGHTWQEADATTETEDAERSA